MAASLLRCSACTAPLAAEGPACPYCGMPRASAAEALLARSLEASVRSRPTPPDVKAEGEAESIERELVRLRAEVELQKANLRLETQRRECSMHGQYGPGEPPTVVGAVILMVVLCGFGILFGVLAPNPPGDLGAVLFVALGVVVGLVLLNKAWAWREALEEHSAACRRIREGSLLPLGPHAARRSPCARDPARANER